MYEKGHQFKKLSAKRFEESRNKVKLTVFQEGLKHLIDVSACKCKEFLDCSCLPNERVPPKEQAFLLDQRSSRSMIIGSVDVPFTNRLNKSISKRISAKTIENTPDTNNYCATASSSTTTSQMRVNLPTVAQECDRFQLSDRSAAAIANAVLKDVGIISENDRSMVIDRNKIRRERQKVLYCERESKATTIFFDGRKDETLQYDGKVGSTQEEHITILSEPHSQFIGHITPNKGDAQTISTALINFLILCDNFNVNELNSIGCDGTAVNTGASGGVITLLEKHFEKSLQWIICLLHANELPLRHILRNLDGSTRGPNSFSGPIGLQLANAEKMPMEVFDPIVADEIEFDSKDLSNDQTYLLKITNSVSSGVVDQYVLNNNPGRLNHSRWLTTANRILRVYIATAVPTQSLKLLAQYIMRVYSPMWFEIKKKPSIESGSKHFLRLLQSCNSLPSEIRSVSLQCLRRNAFFAHSENIILSLLCDSQIETRKQGLEILAVSREEAQSTRKFILPSVNENANTLIEMLDVSSIWHSPPLLSHLTLDEITSAVNAGSINTFIEGIPCHSQAVERHVRLVTKAARSVCGENRRNLMVKNTIESQSKNSSFDSKCKYNF